MNGWETPYFRRILMDASNNVTTLSVPTTFYLGLTTQVLSKNAIVMPTPSIECVGNGYGRTAVTWDATFWGTADATGTAFTIGVINTFTASATWTTPGLGYFFSDASSGGNIWVAGAFLDAQGDPIPVLPFAGEQVTYPAGTFSRSFVAP